MWKAQIALCSAAVLAADVPLESAAVEPAQQTIKGCTCKSTCSAGVSDLYNCDYCRTEKSADGSKCGNWGLGGRWDYCKYTADANFEKQSWEDKRDIWWGKIIADKTRADKYPSATALFKDSIQTTFDNYKTEFPAGREKLIHTIGSICKFKLDIQDSPYTGLLGKGVQEGFIRMGSAAPYSNGGLTPGLGFKFPRTNRHSGDFVALHKLDLGQSWNFFKNPQSNHIPAPTGATAILAKKFNQASQCAPQVGISDLAAFAQDGTAFTKDTIKFPFKLLFMPSEAVQMDEKEKTVDEVHNFMGKFPVGTTIYTVYACGKAMSTEAELKPTEGTLEEICGEPHKLGDLVTTSECTTSNYGDHKFQIRHQRVEEDWQLEPSFMTSYDAAKACGASSVTAEGVPERCYQEDVNPPHNQRMRSDDKSFVV